MDWLRVFALVILSAHLVSAALEPLSAIALFSAIGVFSGIGGIFNTLLQSLMKRVSPPPIAVVGSIKNYSKHELKLLGTCERPTGIEEGNDRVNKPIWSVKAGETMTFQTEGTGKKNGLFCHFQTAAAIKTTTKQNGDVKKVPTELLFRFLYKVDRVKKESSQNLLVISVCNPKLLNTPCTRIKKDEMEKGGSDKFAFGTRAEHDFTKGATELRVNDDSNNLCVIATMSSTSYAEMYIEIYPRHYEDLKEKTGDVAEEEAQKEWSEFIERKCNHWGIGRS